MIHGEKAHSLYFGKDAFADMMDGSVNPDNKELYIIPGATHCDLYDGGVGDFIRGTSAELLQPNTGRRGQLRCFISCHIE